MRASPNYSSANRSSANRFWLLVPLLFLSGCTPPAPAPPPAEASDKTPGVTANSGGDTRGTILFRPGPPAANAPDPYAAVSSKIVLPQRQKLAYALGEIDLHAHQQAAHAYPVPAPSAPGYTKQKAQTAAEQQALFNAYLLEKYHARFCNQFHVTYDQLVLIREEGRDKNWPMPPSPKE